MFLPTESGSPSDFDFFIGEWNVRHRRLKSRLNQCTEWEIFSGQNVAKKILGGYGNVDDNVVELPGDRYRAATLRAFNEKTSQWSIWWLDGRNPGSLDTPVVGSFRNGLGTFLAHDNLNGTPIIVRFLWSVPELDQPRWEQAFSPDGGHSWETNWVMEFSRR